jgi:eukaryotic-like serine/threonine-protein kinase
MADPQPDRTLDDDTSERAVAVRDSSDTLPSKAVAQSEEVVLDKGPGPDLPIVPRAVYDPGQEIARGGLGRIYTARDLRLDRVVAIKELLQPTSSNQRRFLREIEVTVGLEHPNIVAIHEAGRWPDGQPFYSMNYVRGSTLEDAIAECHTLEQRLSLLNHVINVAEAVAYAHDKGVVHRDLKPANVLVGRFGETVVIDWGLAKVTQEDDGDDSHDPTQHHTRAGAVVGTPPYMPPEQARGGGIGARADVYALGVILYQLLSGRTPFSDVPQERLLDAIQRQTPAPLSLLVPELAPDLLAIVDKAMAREEQDRYQSAREMVDELRRYSAGRLVAAYSYSATDLFLRFVRRHLAAVVTAVVAALTLLALATYGFRTISDERDSARRHAEDAENARIRAETRTRALVVAEALALTDSDPTEAVSRLKHLRELKGSAKGAISVAARAEELGVAEAVLTGAGNQLACAAFSPDGRWVAAAGESQEVLLWSLEGPESSKPFGPNGPRELRGHTERISDCVFSPDGGSLASTGYDGQVILWSLEDATQRLLPAPGGTMRSLHFSTDGTRLSGASASGVTRQWWLSGGTFRDLVGQEARRPILDYHVDGGSLLTGPFQGTVRLWTPTQSGQGNLVDAPQELLGTTVAKAVDADRILVGTERGTLHEWHPRAQTTRLLASVEGAISDLDVAHRHGSPAAVVATMNGDVFTLSFEPPNIDRVTRHGERVSAARLDPSGRYVASASWDKTVHLVDLDTRAVRVLRGHRDVVSALAFSADGERLLSGSWDNTLRLWPVRQNPYAGRRVLRGHSVGVHAGRFSPSGTHVASGGHDDTVRLWNLATGEQRVLSGHTDHVYRVVYSHDGKYVASSSDDRTVRVWSTSGDEVRVLMGHLADVEELAFSPNGSLLLSASEDGTARLWELRGEGSLVLSHDRAVTNVAFSPAGERFVTASRSGQLRIYRVPASLSEPLQPEQTIDFGDEPWAVDFGKSGDWFAAADLAGRLDVRQFSSGKALDFPAVPRAVFLRFSPDEKRIGIGTDDGKLWCCELENVECNLLQTGQSAIHTLAFTPDSTMLYAAGGSGLVYGWDVASGEHRIYQGHRAPIFDLDISSDGSRVVTASADETLRIWPVLGLPRAKDLQQFLEALTRHTVERGTLEPLPEPFE